MVRSGSLPLMNTQPLPKNSIAAICEDSFIGLFVEVCKTGWCSFQGVQNKRTTLVTSAIHTGVMNERMNERKLEVHMLLSLFRLFFFCFFLNMM